MEEKDKIEVINNIQNKKPYDSFIYSLPFKAGAIISSLVILVLGLVCVISFMQLWEGRIYNMTAAEIATYISNYDGANRHIPPIAEVMINLRYVVVPLGIVLGILFLVDIVFIFVTAGHKRGSEALVKFPTSDWSFEITCLLYFLFFGFGLQVSTERVDGYRHFLYFNIVSIITLVVFYFLLLGFFLNIAVNLKAKTLFKNMLIVRTFRFIFGSIGKAIENADVTKKVFLYFGVFAGSEFGVLLFFSLLGVANSSRILFYMLFLINILAFVLIYKVMTGVKELETAEKNIIAGNLDYKLNVTKYKGDMKILADGLNEIGRGLENAVSERMKSERFKTELITNVSHDIKTPLTSIINYTDLLKKENIETEPIKGYIEVLDRQSERLKKLITDLLEASKASSGNVKMEMSEVDAGLMLEQVYGEYQDKFEKAGLTGVVTKPDKTVTIKADVNHLFRVFDNILGNAVKYAQPDTRVYIDLIKNDNKVTIAFKNISKEKLNITGEELMERFVRGDRSRNTEGSGLGLSIAKSLVGLMGGELFIIVDGDLFKVEVRF